MRVHPPSRCWRSALPHRGPAASRPCLPADRSPRRSCPPGGRRGRDCTPRCRSSRCARSPRALPHPPAGPAADARADRPCPSARRSGWTCRMRTGRRWHAAASARPRLRLPSPNDPAPPCGPVLARFARGWAIRPTDRSPAPAPCCRCRRSSCMTLNRSRTRSGCPRGRERDAGGRPARHNARRSRRCAPCPAPPSGFWPPPALLVWLRLQACSDSGAHRQITGGRAPAEQK